MATRTKITPTETTEAVPFTPPPVKAKPLPRLALTPKSVPIVAPPSPRRQRCTLCGRATPNLGPACLKEGKLEDLP